jgi:flagellin-like hook-associated protein FlgL
VTRLLSDQTALQASYQALAQVRSLSLLNFLK